MVLTLSAIRLKCSLLLQPLLHVQCFSAYRGSVVATYSFVLALASLRRLQQLDV